MSEKFDILIKSGRLIDGTGNPYYIADIGIAGERIARIQKDIDTAASKQIIHASGLVVSPGFFDTHTHDDMYLLFNPRCDEKILQGVTTVVVGNCGFSVGPILEDHRAEMTGFMKVMGGQYLAEEDFNVRTLADYLGKLEASKPGINIISLVGHSTIRVAVLGSEHRAPTDKELKKMKELVGQAMEDGACGLSTGLIYAPGNYAKTGEIIQLAKEVGPYKGIYASHIRNEGNLQISAINEAIKIGEETGLPVHIAHHKIAGKPNWGMSVDTLRMMSDARARGIEITCDQYPYTAGSTFLAAVLPPQVLAGGDEVFSEKLKDSKFRAQVISMVEKDTEKGGWENLIKGGGFEEIIISVSAKHPNYVGKSIAEIAKMENKNPYDVIFDLVVQEKREAIAILFMMCEDDIQKIMQEPFTMIGSDGIPSYGVNKVHPRFSGTFPRILGRYVRELGILTLEEAIRKMTSLPAQTFGVKRKGLLKEGFDADVVIFDPETVIDRATYEAPNQGPEGIHYVLVNGQIAAHNGKIVGATSGRILH